MWHIKDKKTRNIDFHLGERASRNPRSRLSLVYRERGSSSPLFLPPFRSPSTLPTISIRMHTALSCAIERRDHEKRHCPRLKAVAHEKRKRSESARAFAASQGKKITGLFNRKIFCRRNKWNFQIYYQIISNVKGLFVILYFSYNSRTYGKNIFFLNIFSLILRGYYAFSVEYDIEYSSEYSVCRFPVVSFCTRNRRVRLLKDHSSIS